MTPTKINPGQFQKMTRRYVEELWWGRVRVHAMAYDREGRVWAVRCCKLGLPGDGFMVPTTEDQPAIDCRRCLVILGDAV